MGMPLNRFGMTNEMENFGWQHLSPSIPLPIEGRGKPHTSRLEGIWILVINAMEIENSDKMRLNTRAKP